MTKILLIGAATLFFSLGGCAKEGVISAQQEQSGLGSSPPPYSAANPPPAINSNIDFSAITWPTDMGLVDQRALELALNISGSFEGRESWSTISNNSDKQGMSLGLLSQNFGSGTLQPLLIDMRDHHPDVMTQIFSKTHLAALYTMLATWESQGGVAAHAMQPRVSILDMVMVPMVDPDTASVAWAVKNLYTNSAGTSFATQWKAEFQSLAVAPVYINLQFGEALIMHALAKAYALQAGIVQLRTYLMMFDVVDQDGDMPTGDFVDYRAYLAANPNATADDRLTEIVNLRLRHVNPVYVNDVKSRKMTIVNGQGLVHGAQRDLESEYNFNRLEIY